MLTQQKVELELELLKTPSVTTERIFRILAKVPFASVISSSSSNCYSTTKRLRQATNDDQHSFTGGQTRAIINTPMDKTFITPLLKGRLVVYCEGCVSIWCESCASS